MHIHDLHTAHTVSEVVADTIQQSKVLAKQIGAPVSRSRAQSLDQTTAVRSHSILHRLKHTYEFKLKGFKGNIRGEHIQAPFTILEEMLCTLPESLGIDIELSNNSLQSIFGLNN